MAGSLTFKQTAGSRSDPAHGWLFDTLTDAHMGRRYRLRKKLRVKNPRIKDSRVMQSEYRGYAHPAAR